MKSDTKIGIFVVLVLVAVVVLLLGREIMNRKKNAQPEVAARSEGTDEPFGTTPPADGAKSERDLIAGGPTSAPQPATEVAPPAPPPAPGEVAYDPSKSGLEPIPGPAPAGTTQPLPPVTPEQPTVAETGPKEYVVKSGDMLQRISKQFYGKRSQWKLIAEANPGVNPNHLKVGTKLVIPPAPSTPVEAVASGPVTSGAKTYTVKKGDLLSTISKQFYGKQSRWELIAQANPGVNANRLRVGTVLNIPDAPASVAPVAEASAPVRHHAAKASSSKEPWRVRGATRLVTAPARAGG